MRVADNKPSLETIAVEEEQYVATPLISVEDQTSPPLTGQSTVFGMVLILGFLVCFTAVLRDKNVSLAAKLGPFHAIRLDIKDNKNP
ncbi:MAG: hypothetical protein ACFE0J_04770 [Elainellaceae cyanobacterium]